MTDPKHAPHRKVYRKTDEGEEGPLPDGLMGVKAGQTIRLEPIDKEDAKHCPVHWFTAGSDGYMMGVPNPADPNGPHMLVQAITIEGRADVVAPVEQPKAEDDDG